MEIPVVGKSTEYGIELEQCTSGTSARRKLGCWNHRNAVNHPDRDSVHKFDALPRALPAHSHSLSRCRNLDSCRYFLLSKPSLLLQTPKLGAHKILETKQVFNVKGQRHFKDKHPVSR